MSSLNGFIKKLPARFPHYLALGSIFLLTALLFFHLNDLSGYASDDFLYHFMFRGEWPHVDQHQINNFFDLFISIYNHTTIWNGRIVAHTLAQTFLQFPKPLFNGANTLMFLIIGVQINLFLKPQLKDLHPFNLSLTYLLMFLFLPDYGHSIMWETGSFNYLWASFFYLNFLLLFRWHYQPRRPSLPITLIILFLSFCAGNTNENIGPVVIIIGYLYYRSNQALPLSQHFWGLISCLMGSITLITHNNGEKMAQNGGIFNISGIIASTWRLSGALICLIFILIIIITSAMLQNPKWGKNQWRNIYSPWWTALLLILGSVVSIGALVLSPQLPDRTWFGSNLFLIITFLVLLNELPQLGYYYPEIHQQFRISLLAVLLLFSYSTYYLANRTLAHNYQAFNTEVEIIKQTPPKLSAKVPIMIDTENKYSPYFRTAFLEGGNDPNHKWANAWMAKYYGVKAVFARSDQALLPNPKFCLYKYLPWAAWMNYFNLQ
ncbi:hypothetical protein HU830_04595 [Lactobacillus sp. DCY120]|uniref:Uncharacterized protein n=1 Tax=Bombilactobacillus apium TaxID=2675299 RepID=A0A850R3A1_9LACO|nr:DUF6056 family protein [Bombilactobacillus apium]NVY96451.1 hypothetical protein [Bombilactobacillus apium]